MQTRFIAILALILLELTPLAAADQISGYSRAASVTDQAKHTLSSDDDVTFVDYTFQFTGNGPNPQAPNVGDRVATAWVLLNIQHGFHTTAGIFTPVDDTNVVTYKITFNGLLIEYDTQLTAHDDRLNPAAFLHTLNPFADTTQTFGNRGTVTIHYSVYDTTGRLVADQTETDSIRLGSIRGIPDTNLWIAFENRTLTITPEFNSRTLMPRFFSSAPTQSVGRVLVQNATYQSLELQVTATKTLDHVKLAYGFGKPGNVPGYTLGSLLGDAATSIASLLGGAVNAIVDFVFKFIPEGDKLLVLKDYVNVLIDTAWEILLQDPVLALRVVVILALAYGLLLFIDPLFRFLFAPVFLIVKGFWKLLVLIWAVFLWIARFIISKIPTGGG